MSHVPFCSWLLRRWQEFEIKLGATSPAAGASDAASRLLLKNMMLERREEVRRAKRDALARKREDALAAAKLKRQELKAQLDQKVCVHVNTHGFALDSLLVGRVQIQESAHADEVAAVANELMRSNSELAELRDRYQSEERSLEVALAEEDRRLHEDLDRQMRKTDVSLADTVLNVRACWRMFSLVVFVFVLVQCPCSPLLRPILAQEYEIKGGAGAGADGGDAMSRVMLKNMMLERRKEVQRQKREALQRKHDQALEAAQKKQAELKVQLDDKVQGSLSSGVCALTCVRL